RWAPGRLSRPHTQPATLPAGVRAGRHHGRRGCLSLRLLGRPNRGPGQFPGRARAAAGPARAAYSGPQRHDAATRSPCNLGEDVALDVALTRGVRRTAPRPARLRPVRVRPRKSSNRCRRGLPRMEPHMPPSLNLAYPFTGRWLTQNSPANRVPSHGTTKYAASYAIDFVPVDDAGGTAPITLRTLIRPEAATRFPGFGRPILAPVH